MMWVRRGAARWERGPKHASLCRYRLSRLACRAIRLRSIGLAQFLAKIIYTHQCHADAGGCYSEGPYLLTRKAKIVVGNVCQHHSGKRRCRDGDQKIQKSVDRLFHFRNRPRVQKNPPQQGRRGAGFLLRAPEWAGARAIDYQRTLTAGLRRRRWVAIRCRLRRLTDRRRRFIDRARLLNLGQVVQSRVLLLGFATPGAKRHVFDLGINALAFRQGEFRPGFQRHAR